jgi:hypothetical protein
MTDVSTQTEDRLKIALTDDASAVDVIAKLNAAALSEGVSAGTVLASKFVQVDANLDISQFRNVGAVTLSLDSDDITDGVVNVLTLSHTSSDDNATNADGVGISFELENATGTSTVEEWASIDVVSTTITDGSEDGDIVVKLMAGGTVVPALTLDSSDQSLTIGANSTDADGFSMLRIFPVTASKGSLTLTAIASTGDTVTNIQNAAQAGARTYTIPDAGASASFLMTQGAQTVVGAQTFTGLASWDQDDTTDGIVNVFTLSHTSSDDDATAGDGIGLSFELENATGTSTVEEWASIDVLSTTITDGSEDGDVVVSLMAGGTVVPALTLDSSDQSLTIGANSTDADGFSMLRIFPVTASKGSLTITSIASTGDTVTDIRNAAQAGARTYTIPDAGASANFVMMTSAQAAAGTLTRADLTQENLKAYRIPFCDLWENGGTNLLHGNADSGTSGFHYVTESAGVYALMGNSPNSTTETDTSVFQWVLPPEYVDGETVTVRINAKYTADGDTKTLDLLAYEAAADGSVGSDICDTSAVTLTGSSTNHDFTITPTSLAAGDMLSFEIVTVFQDSDGAVGEAQINSIQVLCDIKG